MVVVELHSDAEVSGFGYTYAHPATARIIAPKLSESMGENWVVDNRTGAAGNIARTPGKRPMMRSRSVRLLRISSRASLRSSRNRSPSSEIDR